MGKDQNYIQDLNEIRSMMERSSKFLSLSGWAGTMAGIYALTGACVAYTFYHFNPDKIVYSDIESERLFLNLDHVIFLALIILILAIGTAIFLSCKKADKKGEKVWNAASRRLLANMAVPLLTGGILIVILISKGLIGLIAPSTLLFYGLALYNASKFSYDDLKFLGLIQIILGLISCWFIEYSILIWAIGFGLIHIAYGIYMYFRYER